MLLVSICAPADTAPIARVTGNARRLKRDSDMDFPRPRRLDSQIRHIAIGGKYVANRRREMGLEIEPFAGFGAWPRLFPVSVKPFCGKKICINEQWFSS